MTRVHVRHAVLASVAAHARGAAPNECCGLLLGSRETIDESWPARNQRDSPNRFLVRPRDHFDALRVARATGRIVCGAYHSHPNGRPHPSETDAAELIDRSLLQLIVSLAGGTPRIHLFEWTAGDFAAVSVVPVP